MTRKNPRRYLFTGNRKDLQNPNPVIRNPHKRSKPIVSETTTAVLCLLEEWKRWMK